MLSQVLWRINYCVLQKLLSYSLKNVKNSDTIYKTTRQTYPKDRDLRSEDNLQNIKKSVQVYQEPKESVILNVKLRNVNSSKFIFLLCLYGELRCDL
jgi:hypothetical protein